MLACLAACVERTGYLHTTKGAVFEEASVFTCEGDALSYTLIYDIGRAFGEAVHVCFAGAVVATFDCIVEETVYTIAVILIILSGVDTSLCCDAMRAAWAVMERKALDVIPQFAEGSSCSSAGETGADHDHIEAEFVVGGHEGDCGFILFPFGGDRAGRNFTI